jgi:hypothetical protein
MILGSSRVRRYQPLLAKVLVEKKEVKQSVDVVEAYQLSGADTGPVATTTMT